MVGEDASYPGRARKARKAMAMHTGTKTASAAISHGVSFGGQETASSTLSCDSLRSVTIVYHPIRAGPDTLGKQRGGQECASVKSVRAGSGGAVSGRSRWP